MRPHIAVRHTRRRPIRLLGALAALAALSGQAWPAGAAEHPAADGPISWSPDLSVIDTDDVDVRYGSGQLRVAQHPSGPASVRTRAAAQGSLVLAEKRLDRAVDRVRARLDAEVPRGAEVALDVRGRSTDRGWSEWHTAPAGGTAVRLPYAVDTVQVRLTLRGAETAVRKVELTADTAPQQSRRTAASPVKYRLFATREGLVGGTTANGHVIQPNDHFVALPSRRGLSPKGTWDYSVQVCGPARCETAPVWDVGPWNTKDDYWNPSGEREMWRDLPQGTPEAQAAYQSGYNGGLDEFGRRVANPAGIDLADGTFYNVGLNDNGWVDVTFLWTGDQTGATFPTWGTDVAVRQASTTSSAVVARLPGPTQVRVSCQERGETVTYEGHTNDAWSYLPDYDGYISNIFIDVAEAWLPGVPEC
ncbi:SH3 domain-containing protein [Streptomyces mesophilus]|uniref:SH3 domain-containing protein n=1 Tax=Streptomyces mesophilus TaxID=1775132 RepID=UPI0033222AA4